MANKTLPKNRPNEDSRPGTNHGAEINDLEQSAKHSIGAGETDWDSELKKLNQEEHAKALASRENKGAARSDTSTSNGAERASAPEKQTEYDEDHPDLQHYNPAADRLNRLEHANKTTEDESEEDKGKEKSPKDLKSAEGAGALAGGGLFNDEDGGTPHAKGSPKKLLMAALSKQNRKKTLGGAGILGGGTLFLMFMAISVPSLKTIHIMTNLEQRFFGTTERAVERQAEHIIYRYFTKHVAPGLGPLCTSTNINRSCVGAINGNSLFAQVSRGLRDSRFEARLAQGNGLGGIDPVEMRYNATTHHSEFKIGEKIFDSADGNFKNSREFNKAWREAIKDNLADKTFTRRTLTRFRVRLLGQRKYGQRWCATCEDVKIWAGKEVRFAKLTIIERVITPHFEKQGIILECMISGECEAYTRMRAGETFRMDEGEAKMVAKLQEKAAKYGTGGLEKVDELVEIANRISKVKFSGYLVERVVEALFKRIGQQSLGQGAGKAAAKAIPIVGWIDLGLTIVYYANTGASHLKGWIHTINALAAANFFQVYRTFADEWKKGLLTPAMAGSVATSFSEFQDLTEDGKETGAAAEASPMWGEIFSNGKNVAKLGDDRLNPKCDDRLDLDAARRICPEENLNAAGVLNFFLNAWSFFTRGSCSPENMSAVERAEGLDKVGAGDNGLLGGSINDPSCTILLANVWHATVTRVLDFLGSVVFNLLLKGLDFAPGGAQIKEMIQWLTNAGEAVFGKLVEVVTKFIPTPIKDVMSATRVLHILAAGADVMGNDFAHTLAGAKKLTNAQAFTLRMQYEEDRQAEFARRPLYARLFDTKSNRSLISRIAVATPTNRLEAIDGFFASLIANPFAKIAQGMSAIIPSPLAHAALAAPDPFGVSQYGWTEEDLDAMHKKELEWDAAHPGGDDMYTPEYCEAMDTAYYDAGTNNVNPDTGVEENTTVNPCRLNTQAACSVGLTITAEVRDECNPDVNNPVDPSKQKGLYILGDSYIQGASLTLSTKLSDRDHGWKPIVDAQQSRPLAGAGLGIVDQASAQSAIKESGAVLIELGTNDLTISNGNAAAFKTNVIQMVQKIKAQNAGAKIYWVNLYTHPSLNLNVSGFNTALAEAAGAENFEIIDWAAIAAPHYDVGQVHPRTLVPYVDLIAERLGKAPE